MKITALVVSAAYFGLSALCLFAPSLLAPEAISGYALLGPPALLLHGAEMWPAFAVVTLVLFLLLAAACSYHEASPIPIGLAAGLWLLTGFYSAAISI